MCIICVRTRLCVHVCIGVNVCALLVHVHVCMSVSGCVCACICNMHVCLDGFLDWCCMFNLGTYKTHMVIALF